MWINHNQFSLVQLLSHVQLFAIPWTAASQASLSITNSRSLPKLMSLESWCHPAISSSVILFSSCPQSLPASGSFQMRQLFTWGGQSMAVSALASVLPMNTQDWSPLEWTGWISCTTIRLFLQMRKVKHGHMINKWGGQDVNSGRSHRQFCLPFVYSSHPEELETLTFHFWML